MSSSESEVWEVKQTTTYKRHTETTRFLIWIWKYWDIHLAWDPPAWDPGCSRWFGDVQVEWSGCTMVERGLHESGKISSPAACLLIAVDVSAGYSLMRLLRYWGHGVLSTLCVMSATVQSCTRGVKRQAASAVSGVWTWCSRVFSYRKLHVRVCFALFSLI